MTKTVTLEREKIYSGNLLLVNLQHPIQNTKTKGLVCALSGFPQIRLQREAADALQAVLTDIAAGNSIVPVSGYRSQEEQVKIYENTLRDSGEPFTKKFVALPGHSEHQTGLAIDLGLRQNKIDFICPDFPDGGICGAFRKTAPNYGFVERYAKQKEEITGIAYEPWHFRYVGYPHSKIMTENGFSLEEYIGFLKTRFWRSPKIKIYYVPARSEKTVISIPEKSAYQISGDNIGGFIVTVWRNR